MGNLGRDSVQENYWRTLVFIRLPPMDNAPRHHPRFSTDNYHRRSDDIEVSKLVRLVTEVLGIQIRHSEVDGFYKKVYQRVQALKLSSLEEYYQLLLTNNKSEIYRAEWRTLIELLTIPESYFFRDQGQFFLLKNLIIPEIIERKRGLNSGATYTSTGNQTNLQPTLRLWSAGCSTGEEAYSLAMLLRDLLPDYQKWNILIVGTDVNQSAIEWAKRGIYSNWSFRTTETDIRNRYFRSCKGGWEISSSVRSMVTFLPGNLIQDLYPNPSTKMYDFDLILCRNVFIYFDAKAIELVLKKFYHSLVPQGYLLTGHMELQGQTIAPFEIRSFSQSTLYQRPSAERLLYPVNLESNAEKSTLIEKTIFKQGKQNAPSRNTCLASPSSSPSDIAFTTQPKLISNHYLDDLEKLRSQKAYRKVIETIDQLHSQISNSLRIHYLKAEAYANLGDYAKAKQACQEALQLDPLAIDPYYLLAQVAEVQGDLDGAKVFLKRIIYLAPTSVYAYFELGALYRREGNVKQAQKLWRSGLELLQGLPHDQPIDLGNRFTVLELKTQILQYLDTI